MAGTDVYEVYAIEYAHRTDRRRSETFITNAWTDPVHDTDQAISYYVWAIVNAERTIVVDTGFDTEEAARRRRESGDVWQPDMRCSPAEGLQLIGVDAATVAEVIITHLHFDHAGTLGQFPKARFHLQEQEMQFATGPNMAHEYCSGAYTVDHVVEMVRHVYGRRVKFHAGDADVAPGVSVHHIGGHTMGVQAVRVRTRRGWVVLASDASHFYDNFEGMDPFPIVHDVEAMLRGFERLYALADGPGHIVPGHDPKVMAKYPAATPDSAGIVVRLDVDPTAS
jgi:glyoxylase-like metal-dependent hydrolase (beta-lactamase superfamily II)